MKVSIRIFDRDESDFLSILIDRAAKRLEMPISFTEVASADVVFLKEDEPGTDILVRSSLVKKKPIAVLYGEGTHEWLLEKPATSKSLLSLLGKLGQQLSSVGSSVLASAAAQAQAQPATRDMTLLPVETGNEVLALMQKIFVSRSVWTCQLAGRQNMLIDGAKGVARVPSAYMEQRERLARKLLETPIESFAELNGAPWEAAEGGLIAIPLEEVLWSLGYTATPVAALAENMLERTFRLKRWPNFSRIEHSADDVSMSGRLMRGPSSIGQLRDDADRTLDSVIRFFNAASLCGLIRLGEPGPSAPPQAAPAQPPAQDSEQSKAKAGLFRSILKRLVG